MTSPASEQTELLPSSFMELLDYRRAVADLYALLRQADLEEPERHHRFRQMRDGLFSSHAQSALSAAQKRSFSGLHYYPYDPAWRFVLPVNTNIEPATIEVSLQADGLTRLQRFGQIRFEADGRQLSLSLYWILGYGGGVFLPFGDQTNSKTSYGGGRYLLDTIKQADLGQEASGLVIDFNYAYNPSCAYNPRWNCPLAPYENRLAISIPAGEKMYPG